MDIQDKLAMLAVLPLPTPIEAVEVLVDGSVGPYTPSGDYYTEAQLLTYTQDYAAERFRQLTGMRILIPSDETIASVAEEHCKTEYHDDGSQEDILQTVPFVRAIIKRMFPL